jgi:hypothetical protein
MNTDEVNHDLAARMAADCGAVVCKLLPQDRLADGLFDAALYNLDDFPRDQRSALVDGLSRGKLDHPTAVHGHDLTIEQARALNRNGVAAARRLHRGLFRDLYSAVRRHRETVPPGDAGTELTWINLVS